MDTQHAWILSVCLSVCHALLWMGVVDRREGGDGVLTIVRG